jgi:hypothetical protein
MVVFSVFAVVGEGFDFETNDIDYYALVDDTLHGTL